MYRIQCRTVLCDGLFGTSPAAGRPSRQPTSSPYGARMVAIAPPVPPTITLARLTELARHTGSPSVSIMMPIDRRHPDDRLDHGVLDRLVDRARAALDPWRAGVDIDALIAPMRAALERRVVAEHGESVVFFTSPGFAAELEVGRRIEPLCVVGDRFEVSPLVPCVDLSVGGHVLALGAEHVRLYRIGAVGLHECDVDDLPRSVDEALWFERTERHSGAHSGGQTGRRATVRRGHGSGVQQEDRKARLDRYFHLLDHAVLAHVGADRSHPLVVAGTGPMVTRYRAVSRHPWPLAVDLGSTVRLGDDELRRRVSAEVAAATSIDPVLERFDALLGTGLAGSDPAEVLNAAADGAVAHLLVAGVEPWWALWPDSTARLADPVPGAVDLVNQAVTDALRSHATVLVVPADRLPDDAPLGALYRY